MKRGILLRIALISAMIAVVAVVALKLLHFDSAMVIAGGIAGGISGVIASILLSKNSELANKK